MPDQDGAPTPDDAPEAAPDAGADAAPDRAPDRAPAGAPAGAPATLARAVHEIERHVAGGGWDGPVRVFALVRTARALADDPGLADRLPADVVAAARADAEHLTSVEQEGLPAAASLEELLGRLSWPATVDGAAVVVERVVLPTAAEAAMPADPEAALDYLMAHPERQDVRIAVGALRSGGAWCAVRTRAADDDAAVAGGADLVPGLVAAVAATLED